MVEHHKIPANAGQFLDMKTLSNKNALEGVDTSISGVREWRDFLISEEAFRSGFAARTEDDVFGWRNAAWKINPHDKEGVFHVWDETTFLTLRVVRGMQACENVLRIVFGLRDEDMPSSHAIKNSFGLGLDIERSQLEWERLIKEGKPETLHGLDDFEMNFIQGYEDVSPILSVDALVSARQDGFRESRSVARKQAAAAFPAFIMTSPDIVKAVDSGAPLTKLLTQTYGVTPSCIKALREVNLPRRVHPELFRGVYGPDVPKSGPEFGAFRSLLGFCSHNDLSFSLFAPLATRTKPRTIRTFLDVFAFALGVANASGEHATRVLVKNGGTKHLRGVCTLIEEKIKQRRLGERALIERAQSVPPLPDITVDTGVKGVTLSLIKTSEHALALSDTFMRGEKMKAEVFDAPVFKLVIEERGTGHYVSFKRTADEPGSAHFYEKMFHKMLVSPPDGFSDMESLLAHVSAHVMSDTRSMSIIERLGNSNKMRTWSEKTKSLINGHNAVLRRTSSVSPYQVFGFSRPEDLITEFRGDEGCSFHDNI